MRYKQCNYKYICTIRLLCAFDYIFPQLKAQYENFIKVHKSAMLNY